MHFFTLFLHPACFIPQVGSEILPLSLHDPVGSQRLPHLPRQARILLSGRSCNPEPPILSGAALSSLFLLGAALSRLFLAGVERCRIRLWLHLLTSIEF